MSEFYYLQPMLEVLSTAFYHASISEEEADPPPSDIPEDRTFDHILVPKQPGEVLLGHTGEADRFYFDHPDVSPNLVLRLDQDDIDLEDKTQLYWNGYPIKTDAVRVLKFSPKDGDVLDFSGLPAGISLSGHTPKPYSIWIEELDTSINHYPVHIDLDGDPRSVEMGIFLAPTPEDLEPIGHLKRPGEVLTGQMINTHKEIIDGMILLPA